ncbi:hypothetical protein KY290_024928 [Solanum tuberosum]|uniref:Uncharacterized protein n=1 Tax=Solanum tuberosum TaxID=4113 RepID=A0ABQ7UU38_SOLTU|nr:hypothetical protein KY284_023784 [Solanum tuberosum]KAH0754658.1 hypothetical protein KY290_024928 [Solanum tuberosum]
MLEAPKSLQLSDGGGSVAMSMDNNSIGSNGFHTRILNHQGLKRVRNNYFVVASVNRRRVSHGLSDDVWIVDFLLMGLRIMMCGRLI